MTDLLGLGLPISLAAPAEADDYAAFEGISEAAPMHSEAWLTRLFEAILSLENPARCPIIPEAGELGFAACHLLHGMGRCVYRIIFDIREKEQHVCYCGSRMFPVIPSPPPM
jgi:hypothetical protein